MIYTLLPISKLVDRAAIRQYAAITDDFNPIHVDPEFAARSPMGGIIAHGMLSLNLIWQSLRASLGALDRTPITLEVRFTQAVRENDTVTSGGRRMEDGAYDVWVRNQKEEDVIRGVARVEEATR